MYISNNDEKVTECFYGIKVLAKHAPISIVSK